MGRKKISWIFSVLFYLFGCTAPETETSSSGGGGSSGGITMDPETDCPEPGYEYGEQILYVCAEPLSPPFEVSGENSIYLAEILFVNLRDWGNRIDQLCVTFSPESESLEGDSEIESIDFEGLNGAEGAFFSATGPFQGNRVCGDIQLLVGARTQARIFVRLNFYSPYAGGSRKYRLTIPDPEDITLFDEESIVGGFPLSWTLISVTSS